MKVGKIIDLEDVGSGFSFVFKGVEYTDIDGARVFVPERLLIRLYEGCKYHYEKNNTTDQSWSEYCDSLFDQ